MLPSLGEPPHGPGWLVEIKFDGMRALVIASAREVRIVSRTGRDVTRSFPELPPALCAVLGEHTAIFDVEIMTLGARGHSDFRLLQQRMHRQRPHQALQRRVPVTMAVFDLLRLDHTDLLNTPYLQRRHRLTDLDLQIAPHVLVPEHYDLDPGEMLRIAMDFDLEGIVSKRAESHYRPGHRTGEWIKTPVRRISTLLVGGWLPGTGTQRDVLGALLLGAHDDAGLLRYVGSVGAGFTDHDRAVFGTALTDLTRNICPFSAVPRDLGHARWVEPVLVAEIAHRSWTEQQRLRHPSFQRLLTDVDPDTVELPRL